MWTPTDVFDDATRAGALVLPVWPPSETMERRTMWSGPEIARGRWVLDETFVTPTRASPLPRRLAQACVLASGNVPFRTELEAQQAQTYPAITGGDGWGRPAIQQ